MGFILMKQGWTFSCFACKTEWHRPYFCFVGVRTPSRYPWAPLWRLMDNSSLLAEEVDLPTGTPAVGILLRCTMLRYITNKIEMFMVKDV